MSTNNITLQDACYRQVLGTKNIWRSDAALLLSDKCPADLKDAKVIDLRGAAKGKDIAGLNPVYAEIQNFNDYEKNDDDYRQAFLIDLTVSNLASDAFSATTFERLYGEILKRNENVESLTSIFAEIASAKKDGKKVVLVDNGNKDRVGVVSALISKAAGQSDTDIVNDYTKSDKTKRSGSHNTAEVKKLRGVYDHEKYKAKGGLSQPGAERFLEAPPAAMSGFLTNNVANIDDVLKKYGTTAAAVKSAAN